MLDKNKVLEFVKLNGPLIPRDIMKEMGEDTFIIGAVLSQLKDANQIKVSHTKIGGSPVYYIQGQEFKLQNLYKYLHEKEKKVFDLLKKERVLQDSKLDPVYRVAIRNIKDFANLLEVNLKQRRETFWKWYLLPLKDAEDIIRRKVGLEKPKKEIPKKVEQGLVPKQISEEQEKQQKLKSTEVIKDSFFSKLNNFFNQNKIKIVQCNIIRKNSEIDLTLEIPSAVGLIMYYCKAKNKKKINHGDLSSAYVQGELKKMPVLFITTGELTKRAKVMLNNEFKNIQVKQF